MRRDGAPRLCWRNALRQQAHPSSRELPHMIRNGDLHLLSLRLVLFCVKGCPVLRSFAHCSPLARRKGAASSSLTSSARCEQPVCLIAPSPFQQGGMRAQLLRQHGIRDASQS
jgi:hypothetical protein